ncbi:ABC transporter permease [Mesobacillus maritimus]|uniref:Sugar ABC transporter permease n=1 Tax=Mesobacillus maritimus TaxID=1643336 RepID=A0ABS7K907_9BACI|nr:ABC transporter permease subunit [Mesobacillus maritimus]MBY0098748.1 sugar ABC transporter permease [Mesobacillus maritimus]
MKNTVLDTNTEITIRSKKPTKLHSLWKQIVKHRYFYLLMLPGILFFLIFKYAPMWGLIIAFKDYSPFLGIMGSPWVGFKHFIDLFTYDYFYTLLRNTLVINFLSLILYFPVPIILALLLNEVRHEVFKRVNQSIIYLPHFLSWVVVAGLTFFMLSTDVGAINKLLNAWFGNTFPFLSNENLFWVIVTFQSIWKDAGWGTIIFLAAIAGVNPSLYEAAVMDGANRWRQIWHITLPAIRHVIIILLILRLGSMMDVGFEQIILMLNPLVMEVGDVFDTYAYTQGILRGDTSIGVAVGMFKGIIGLIMILGANWLTKKFGNEGLM